MVPGREGWVGTKESISMMIRATGSQTVPEPAPARSHMRLRGAMHVLSAVGAICILASGAILADAAPAASIEDNPPAGAQGADSRAVRLTNVEGQVRVVQDGQVIADPAYNNLPLFEGSQINTGNDGRAEVQLEDGSVARLSPNSTLTFTVLQ